MKPTLNILIFVLDDHVETLNNIKKVFDFENLSNYRFFTDQTKFLEALNDDVHIAIVDYWLYGDRNGISVIKSILEKNPQCFVIMMSAQSEMDVVVEGVNAGVDRYIMKQKPDWLASMVTFVKEGIEIVKRDLDWYYKLINKLKPNEPVNSNLG
jgi:DNA-binding response OmpR family regulator